jgi:hypothetical protein
MNQFHLRGWIFKNTLFPDVFDKKNQVMKKDSFFNAEDLLIYLYSIIFEMFRDIGNLKKDIH